MEKELAETLKIIKNLNEKIAFNATISPEELIEENDNINDFLKQKEDLQLLLKQINESDFNNTKVLCEKLVYLHLNYSYIIWHFVQMHELIKKLIRKCPD